MPKRKPRPEQDGHRTDRLSLRVDLATGARVGPGKIAVLEEIGRTGSISAAGRALRMSYRRTWDLVEELNSSFAAAVVETASGGSGGGGAALTDTGRAVIAHYRALEHDTAAAAEAHLRELSALARPTRPDAPHE